MAACYPWCREGGQFPVLELCVAAPASASSRLVHTLRHAATGKVVATWSQPTGTDAPGSGGGALAYQQVEHGPGSKVMVQFGASTFASSTHRFVTSMTAPGEYLLELQVRPLFLVLSTGSRASLVSRGSTC